VALRVEKDFNMADIFRVHPGQISKGKIKKIAGCDEHRHARVIHIQKILQGAEGERAANGFNIGVRQLNAIPNR
jgi:hypothetical protein